MIDETWHGMEEDRRERNTWTTWILPHEYNQEQEPEEGKPEEGKQESGG